MTIPTPLRPPSRALGGLPETQQPLPDHTEPCRSGPDSRLHEFSADFWPEQAPCHTTPQACLIPCGPPQITPGILDWAELSRRCDHDHREITALIACFLESSRATLREMTQELRYQNWSGIKQHAHALRGSCLIMTASALAHLCARIEEARFPEIQLLSQRLLSSWRVLEQALIRYLGNAG